MSVNVQLLVLPGSLFCIKVASALEYKGIRYEMKAVHPTKLKKELPEPHQVPVMNYGNMQIGDSHNILKHIDARHETNSKPLYPPVSKGGADTWSTVEELESFAHDQLSHLYYYFGGITDFGKKNITAPFIRSILPPIAVRILPFLPGLGARAAAGQLKKRVDPVLGDAVLNEKKAREVLFNCVKNLESCFKTTTQVYLFDTERPTAADFGVFAALKRFLHPLPDVAGISGAYTDLLVVCNAPQLLKFFHHMNSHFYEGKIDWTTCKL